MLNIFLLIYLLWVFSQYMAVIRKHLAISCRHIKNWLISMENATTRATTRHNVMHDTHKSKPMHLRVYLDEISENYSLGIRTMFILVWTKLYGNVVCGKIRSCLHTFPNIWSSSMIDCRHKLLCSKLWHEFLAQENV